MVFAREPDERAAVRSILLATVGAYFIVSRRELYLNRIVTEITNRQRVEESLKESEEKFRLTAAFAHDAMIMIDHEGKDFKCQ